MALLNKTAKGQISESFTCLDEFSTAHLTASNHLHLFLLEKDSFSAKQLKLKEIKEREVTGKAAFLQITQEIEEQEARSATLKTQRGVLLQQNRELAASYKGVLQEAQSIKSSLEGKKDAAKEWLSQEEEAVIAKQKCLAVWEELRGFEFDSL